MRILRTSRAERRLQRTANRQQGAPTHAQCYMKQVGGKTDPRTLLEALKLNEMKLPGLASDLHDVIYSDGIGEADYALRIFNPDLADLRTLPPALLDAKDELLPHNLVPATKIELRSFLETLLVRNGRENNVDLLVEGWAGKKSPGSALNAHVEDLWKFRSTHESLYPALVSGRFAPVIRHLQRAKVSTERTNLRDLLIHQAIIWCCHDVQMVVARLSKPVALGALGTNSRAKQSPERELNNQRNRYVALEEILTSFFGSEDWRKLNVDLACLRAESHPKKPAHRWVGRIARELRRDPKAYATLDLDQVTELMREIAAQLREPDESFTRMATPPNEIVEPKTFAAKSFQVTSPITAIAISVRRLIQAEEEMPAIIDEWIANKRSDKPIALRGSLSSYVSFVPPHGSTKRLMDLVRFYRNALFDQSECDDSGANWKHDAESKKFLCEVGARSFNGDGGQPKDRQRSFYLLDVIPEHRFAASGPKKLLAETNTSA